MINCSSQQKYGKSESLEQRSRDRAFKILTFVTVPLIVESLSFKEVVRDMGKKQIHTHKMS